VGKGCRLVLAVWVLTATLVSVFSLGGAGMSGVFSGGTTVNIAVRTVPCSIDGIGYLDTPCEWSLLAWDIDTHINLRCSLENMSFQLNTVFGLPGVEYVAPGSELRWADHSVRATLLFATPFQSVIDAQNQPNSVVIPYGDLLFAGASLEALLRLPNSTVRWHLIFQDVNFPSPFAKYDPPGWPSGEPVVYGLGDQEFAMGSLITLSARIGDGLPLTVQMGLGAQPGSLSVKGYSLSGKANPDRLFVNVLLSGLGMPCPWCEGPIGEPRIGIAIRIEPRDTPFVSLTGSASVVLYETAMLSTSFSLSTAGVSWGGFSINIPHSLGTLNIQLDTSGGFSSASLNWSYRHQFVIGRTRGSCGFTGTWVTERGVIATNYTLSLNQALFSSSYGLHYTWHSEKGLTFSALRLRFTLNLSPVQFSVPIVYGRGGMSTFGISAGYVF